MAINIRLFGNKTRASLRVGEAKKQLRILHEQMKFANLQQYRRKIVLDGDGTVIECISAFGQDLINILSPPGQEIINAKDMYVPEKLYVRGCTFIFAGGLFIYIVGGFVWDFITNTYAAGSSHNNICELMSCDDPTGLVSYLSGMSVVTSSALISYDGYNYTYPNLRPSTMMCHTSPSESFPYSKSSTSTISGRGSVTTTCSVKRVAGADNGTVDGCLSIIHYSWDIDKEDITWYRYKAQNSSGILHSTLLKSEITDEQYDRYYVLSGSGGASSKSYDFSVSGSGTVKYTFYTPFGTLWTRTCTYNSYYSRPGINCTTTAAQGTGGGGHQRFNPSAETLDSRYTQNSHYAMWYVGIKTMTDDSLDCEAALDYYWYNAQDTEIKDSCGYTDCSGGSYVTNGSYGSSYSVYVNAICAPIANGKGESVNPFSHSRNTAFENAVKSLIQDIIDYIILHYTAEAWTGKDIVFAMPTIDTKILAKS